MYTLAICNETKEKEKEKPFSSTYNRHMHTLFAILSRRLRGKMWVGGTDEGEKSSMEWEDVSERCRKDMDKLRKGLFLQVYSSCQVDTLRHTSSRMGC